MKNPISLDAFADWCAKQPADKHYDYHAVRDCAFAQYLRSLGFETAIVSPMQYCIGEGEVRPLPEGVDAAVYGGIFSLPFTLPRTRHTFGALTKRLRRAQEAARMRQGI